MCQYTDQTKGPSIITDIFERVQNVLEGGGGRRPMYSLLFLVNVNFPPLKRKEKERNIEKKIDLMSLIIDTVSGLNTL